MSELSLLFDYYLGIMTDDFMDLLVCMLYPFISWSLLSIFSQTLFSKYFSLKLEVDLEARFLLVIEDFNYLSPDLSLD